MSISLPLCLDFSLHIRNISDLTFIAAEGCLNCSSLSGGEQIIIAAVMSASIYIGRKISHIVRFCGDSVNFSSAAIFCTYKSSLAALRTLSEHTRLRLSSWPPVLYHQNSANICINLSFLTTLASGVGLIRPTTLRSISLVRFPGTRFVMISDSKRVSSLLSFFAFSSGQTLRCF